MAELSLEDIIVQLKANLQGFCSKFSFENDVFSVKSNMFKIQDSLSFVSITVDTRQSIRILKRENEDCNDCIYIGLSSAGFYTLDNYYPSGLGVFFGEHKYELDIEYSPSFKFAFVILNRKYLDVNGLLALFNEIQMQDSSIFWSANIRGDFEELFSSKKGIGLIRTNHFVKHILTTLKIEVLKIEELLLTNIESYCENTFQSGGELMDTLNGIFPIECEEINLVFKRIFKRSVADYYYSFKVKKCRFFLENDICHLNNYILSYLNRPYYNGIQIAFKFGISHATFNELFFQVKGESFYEYFKFIRRQDYSNLINVELLSTHHNNPNLISFNNNY